MKLRGKGLSQGLLNELIVCSTQNTKNLKTLPNPSNAVHKSDQARFWESEILESQENAIALLRAQYNEIFKAVQNIGETALIIVKHGEPEAQRIATVCEGVVKGL